MIILTIRTDKPEAEVGLYRDEVKLDYRTWLADRQLTRTIHREIKSILNKSSFEWNDVGGIIVYEGPGSFTGLRIGISLANALASANQIPVVASSGKKWIENGLENLEAGRGNKLAFPKYGSPPNITKPKK